MLKHATYLALLVASTTLSACATTGHEGCRIDTQCKGDRICEKGLCVSPSSKAYKLSLTDSTPLLSDEGRPNLKAICQKTASCGVNGKRACMENYQALTNQWDIAILKRCFKGKTLGTPCEDIRRCIRTELRTRNFDTRRERIPIPYYERWRQVE